MLFYRRDGSTFTDPMEYSLMLGDIDYRRVALHEGDGWSVSTVFLAVDHNFFGVGPPLLFETLATHGDFEYVERWTNEVAALAGHDQWVALVRDRAAGAKHAG